MAWAQLVRLPNVFTVLADVGAAFLLVSQGPYPLGRFALIVLSGVSLYWAGMILNDVFDIDRDRQERPERPIPAGLIPLGQAKKAGWGLLFLGVILAASSGAIPAENRPATWLPAAVAICLAIMVVAYDGPLKATLLAPAAMGSCRLLSFLLGASPCLSVIGDGPLFPKYVIAIALGFGVYVMGITAMARHEATGGPSSSLSSGWVLIIIGAAVLAFAPQTAGNPVGWHVSPAKVFPIMIGMIALPVVLRGLRAVGDPTPAKIQTTIRVGILTIIPLAASFAVLGAGPAWGLAVFSLAIPSIALAKRFRIT
jgi:4-hydroxybenzoate polyprenyltransferase